MITPRYSVRLIKIDLIKAKSRTDLVKTMKGFITDAEAGKYYKAVSAIAEAQGKAIHGAKAA